MLYIYEMKTRAKRRRLSIIEEGRYWLRGKSALANYTLLMALERQMLICAKAIENPAQAMSNGKTGVQKFFHRANRSEAKLRRKVDRIHGRLKYERKTVPARPRWEYKPIAGEFETEIKPIPRHPYLTASFDDTVSTELTPLEMLIAKEESNS